MNNESHFENRILLKDLINQVRTELAEAVSERERSDGHPMFVLNKLTLEVNFTVERASSVEAGASAKVFALVGVKGGGELSTKSEQVHKVTLELSTFRSPKEKADGLSNFTVGGLSNYAPSNSLDPVILEAIDDQVRKKYPVILANYFKGKKFTCGHDGKFFMDPDLS